MRLFTIGSAGRSAEAFFETLCRAKVARVVDVRLRPTSQLSGFAKQRDLAYFLQTICRIEYTHGVALAPSQELLSAYRAQRIGWEEYADSFNLLIAGRQIERLGRELFDDACLLCSETTPERCHRRLVAEYLAGAWDDLRTHHL